MTQLESDDEEGINTSKQANIEEDSDMPDSETTTVQLDTSNQCREEGVSGCGTKQRTTKPAKTLYGLNVMVTNNTSSTEDEESESRKTSNIEHYPN